MERGGLDVLTGRAAVLEALRAGARSVERVLVADGAAGPAVREVESAARDRGVEVERVDRHRLDALAGPAHQGLVALAAPILSHAGRGLGGLDDAVEAAAAAGRPPLLLVVDQAEDPRNLGAILRTAEAAGVDAVVVPRARSAPLDRSTAKAAAGATEHVRVLRSNVAQALERLGSLGLRRMAIENRPDAEDLWRADLSGPLVLAVGAEGGGLRRLTRERCDGAVRIPMLGRLESLNVSVATAVVLYEVMRRRAAGG